MAKKINLKHFFGRGTTLNSQKRNWNASKKDNLYSQWITAPISTNTALREQLGILRARSRDLYNNSDYFHRWIVKSGINIIGQNGIKFQSRAMENGELDTQDNDKIEKAWATWCQVGNCTVDGRQSFVEVQKNMVECLKRDGEVLFRKIPGWKGNKFGFALQSLDVGVLDEKLNGKMPNGNEVVMGVEVDGYNKPVAYHLFASSDGAGVYAQAGKKYVRVKAKEIIHLFVTEYVGQVRGIPHGVTAMKRLKMLDGYEEAEVVAARVGATKMGFFKPNGDGEYTGERENPDDPDSAFIDEARPGEFDILPDGYSLEKWDPQHNNSSYDGFVKRILKGVCSGLGISYVSASNDLEGVNFSSIRSGTIEDRDEWRMQQSFVIAHFLHNIFEEWLVWAITTQAVALPMSKFDKFNQPSWRARGWEWVDPKKDVEAAILAFNAGFTSLSDIVGQRGGDFEEVLKQISAERKMAEQLGINLVLPTVIIGDSDDGEEKQNT